MGIRKTFISFYLRTNSIHVFFEAVRAIGSPTYIRFLMNGKEMKMVMQAYDKKEFVSFRVPAAVYQGSGSMDVHSKQFCRLVAGELGWDVEKSYRIPGTVYPEQHLVCFDLLQAIEIKTKQ